MAAWLLSSTSREVHLLLKCCSTAGRRGRGCHNARSSCGQGAGHVGFRAYWVYNSCEPLKRPGTL